MLPDLYPGSMGLYPRSGGWISGGRWSIVTLACLAVFLPASSTAKSLIPGFGSSRICPFYGRILLNVDNADLTPWRRARFRLLLVAAPGRIPLPGSLQSESNPSEGQAQIEPAPHRVGVRTGGPFGSPVDIPQIEELPGAEFT